MLISDPDKLEMDEFVVAALWMEGAMTTTQIAKHVAWTPGKVRGFLYRSFNPVRHVMTRADRQMVLDTMLPFRNSYLELMIQAYDHIFTAKEIAPDQIVTNASTEPEFDLATKAGRRQAKEWRDQKARFEAGERRTKAEREQGFAERPEHADVLEWLRVSRKLSVRDDRLTDDEDRARQNQDSAIAWRHAAGLDYRKYFTGSQLTNLGAMDYEAASMGSGASGPAMTLPEFKLFCIRWMDGLRRLLAKEEQDVLDKAILMDVMFWDREGIDSQSRRHLYDSVLHALDVVAFYQGAIAREFIERRWPEYVMPMDDEIKWPSRWAAECDIERMREWMETARKEGAI